MLSVTSIGTRARVLIALVLVAGLALIAPAPAHSGTYRAALCDPELAAFHAGATFERTSRRFRPRTSCGPGGEGLVVTRAAGRAGRGAWGAWVVRAPTGTAITGLAVNAA